MFCPHCGQNNPPDSLFCTYCGACLNYDDNNSFQSTPPLNPYTPPQAPYPPYTIDVWTGTDLFPLIDPYSCYVTPQVISLRC